MTFKALLVDKDDDGIHATIETLNESRLPGDGDVTVTIDYSTLNYKDGLAITGKAPIIRHYPLVPGIDFAGTVAESQHPGWKAGDRVVLNGWGVGESHWGGLSQKARVKGDWLIALPEKLSSYQAMAIGTAGYTAALCIMAILNHGVKPEDGEILVTGANGGVGGSAVAMLADLGYQVVASTGRPEHSDYLTRLGASSLIHRDELSSAGKPLGKERWAAVVDSVGSHTLANACATTKYYGIITACGLAQGMDLPATVAPFILRGVTLAGIESVQAPVERRKQAWNLLAEHMKPELLDEMATTIKLSEAIGMATELLAGKVRGRIVVDVNA